MKGAGKNIPKNHCHHLFLLLWEWHRLQHYWPWHPGHSRQSKRMGFGEWLPAALRADHQPRSHVLWNCRWKSAKQSFRFKPAIIARTAPECMQKACGQTQIAWNTLCRKSHHTSVNGCFGKESKENFCWERRLGFRMQGCRVNQQWICPRERQHTKITALILLTFLSEVFYPSTPSSCMILGRCKKHRLLWTQIKVRSEQSGYDWDSAQSKLLN